jgi:hypothetical protein
VTETICAVCLIGQRWPRGYRHIVTGEVRRPTGAGSTGWSVSCWWRTQGKVLHRPWKCADPVPYGTLPVSAGPRSFEGNDPVQGWLATMPLLVTAEQGPLSC